MTTQRGSRTGVLGAIRERPGLFIILAVMFFATALLASRTLIEPPSIEARLRIDIIDLDREAEDIGSLINPTLLDPESLKSALLEGEGQDAGPGEGRRPAALRDRLTIGADAEEGAFIIRLGGDEAFQADETLNGLLQAFASRQNRRRAEQKTETAFWIERQRTVWQARLDKAKAAIVQNPFNPALPKASGRSESAKLLRFMIDATIEAQEARPAEDLDVALESGPQASSGALAAETSRLTDALQQLEAGRAAQLRHGKQLKEAEAGLARLDRDAKELMGRDGVLDRRAVSITAPAFAEVKHPLQHLRAAGWAVLLPALGIVSLVFALIATLIVCRFRPPIEAASAEHLNDPHWPLPPHAHRELST